MLFLFYMRTQSSIHVDMMLRILYFSDNVYSDRSVAKMTLMNSFTERFYIKMRTDFLEICFHLIRVKGRGLYLH